MPTEIVMPRLSDTMDRGKVAHWNKKTGEVVKRGEVLLEIETDKANMELESYTDGILARIMVNEGETADVGAPIGIVVKDESELKSMGTEPASTGSSNGSKAAGHATVAETSAASVPAAEEPNTAASATSRDDAASSVNEGRVKASPLARRIAKQRDIDLSRVTGSGPGGRIVREDVEAFDGSNAQLSTQPTSPAQSVSTVPVSASGEDREVTLSRMQQTVATRLSQSMATAPHFYVTTEIDMTHAIRMRAQINDAEPELKVSFNDLIVKAAAVTLRRFPRVNSSYDAGKVVERGRVNIGIAVDLRDGLIVPVLKDVDRKTLRDITTETKDLVARARDARLKPDNFEGSTFTVSNLGMFGVDQFTAIINPPESAILAVGAIQEKPVVVEGQVVICSRMRVTLSCDHRVIYGADAAGFLAELRRTLEHPVLTLL